MPDRTYLLTRLATAEDRIAAGRRQVRKQIRVVRELRSSGQDDDLGLRLLRSLRASVAICRGVRDSLMAQLHQVEGEFAGAGEGDPPVGMAPGRIGLRHD
ncbi:hypothetical protein [Cupriavidus plantarum]|uniref:hypothetical protein n=1 Tax=Cupriavidus plantarum TaxID=942865 RepID=UPI0015C80DF3|nr:hypothetical protein [Cupriavidus plantarum]NYI00392.1 hypothetical protein [Cupriavidus plantarum]